jgi:carbon-monoxide dehydrogenase medium subunit
VTPFELVEPQTLGEALELLGGGASDTRAASGCTALMLMMKASVLKPARLISLRRLAPTMSTMELRGAEVHVGALTTLAMLERSHLVARESPVLAHTLKTLANVRVRNQATLGGHLAHADPHMDLPPLLAALDARVVIAGRHGSRIIPIEQLICGYMETTLSPGELITQVRIPLDRERRSSYLKVTSRSTDDWPSLGVAVALRAASGRIENARIVAGAAFDRPTRLASAESTLSGAAISERLLAQAAERAADAAQPIADQHGSAAYKQHLIRVYVGRALRQALDLPLHGTAA